MGLWRTLTILVIATAVLAAMGFGVGLVVGNQPDLGRAAPDPDVVPTLRTATVEGITPNAVGKSSHALETLLGGGGYTMYLRHTNTNKSDTDTVPLELTNCAAQRNLNDEGRELARRIGAAFVQKRIPVGPVYASEFCRTTETAQIAFGKVTQLSALTGITALGAPERLARARELRALIATPPPPGQNTVLVGHWDNLLDALNLKQDAEGQSEVFKSDGRGGITLVARLAPDGWLD